MTIKQVIAEVESIFPQYADAGLIDRMAITNRLISALKKFGNNIMIKREGFLTIKGGKAPLPQDYWHLMVAVKCEPFEIRTTPEYHETLLDSHFYRQRTEERNVWNLTLDAWIPEDTTTIREEFVFKRAKADFSYKQVGHLKLVKAFKRDQCAKDSPYRSKDFAVNSPYEINIYNRHIQTNFSKGHIYMQYYGLPTDDEGDVIIPETQHDELKEYLLYLAQEEVLYRAIMADDDPNAGNKYTLVKQLAKEAKQLAYTETKMEALGNWKEEYIQRKRRQTLAYERLQPRK